MIPEAFKPYRQFVIQQLISLENDKIDKIPLNPRTFRPGNALDPTIQMGWETALTFRQYGFGIGFVFTDQDPFFFIDIDDALQPDGSWSQIAQTLCELFNGCYIEVSISGTGLHIFGTGLYKPHGCENRTLGIQFYHHLRFAALTGTGARGCATYTCQIGIDWLIDTYFPSPGPVDSVDWTTGPGMEWNGITDDRELITKMLDSKSGTAILGGKASIQSLWVADINQLRQFFPSSSGKQFDHSGADEALCSHLAFWTGKNCERMDLLFRQSALIRDKWDRRDSSYGTYGRRTILRAVGFCKKVYGENRKSEINVQKGEYREGFQLKTVVDQVTLFQGCTYIQDLHQIFTPIGCFLKPDQFRAMYGGYVFALDSINDKTTRNAWQSFTESQGYNFPKVQGACFRPELPAGHCVTDENRNLINTYIPITTARQSGDVTPFLNHLALMLPNETDRTILLSYMAACVQYPGVKFQWAPLIQGAQGNGKTMLISVLSHAIGHRYTHLPNASDLGNNGHKFNQWIQNKLLIGIEEIYVSDRREVSEALKPLITNSRIEIQGKGVNQVTGDNRANFMICTNYKNAVFKVLTDRRYCFFYTAQQDVDDMKAVGWITKDGMPTRYFVELYNWLNHEGYAYVNDFLHTYQIPAMYNPATDCHRAPITSSTSEAVGLSLSGVEQEISEMIDRGAPGFAKGWVSSLALDRLLKARRDDKRITYNKRTELLKNMGYILHPGLKNGRVNNIIPMDLGKPRLYVKKDHILTNIENPVEIAKRYVQDQGGDTMIQPPHTQKMDQH